MALRVETYIYQCTFFNKIEMQFKFICLVFLSLQNIYLDMAKQHFSQINNNKLTVPSNTTNI